MCGNVGTELKMFLKWQLTKEEKTQPIETFSRNSDFLDFYNLNESLIKMTKDKKSKQISCQISS